MPDSCSPPASSSLGLSLLKRPRRLRQNAGLRALTRETEVTVDDLIQPVFVKAGGEPEAINSMPGQLRHNPDSLVREAETLASLGIRAMAVFPQIEASLKDAEGSYATRDDNWFFGVLARIKQDVPDLLVMADVALDPFTDHGHDGVLSADGAEVLNDVTVAALAEYSVRLAASRVDIVGPSDMMDGRVRAIRQRLDAAGHSNVVILSYAAKFASALYGPFRDAVGSLQAAGHAHLDKKTYQVTPSNGREAIADALLDEEEGADMLMVKPASLYLDILAEMRRETRLPLAAYQVSGEYAMIQAVAEKGWLDLSKTRDESLLAIKRAGADIILTYFARKIAEELRR